MPDNPYLIPGADDDLFMSDTADTKTKHTYDGTPCSECGGIIHHTSIDDDVPAEVRDELDRIMDSLPQEERGHHVIVTTPESPATQILKDIQDFFVSFDTSIAAGPAIRACIEMLDQMTQNQASVLIELYTKEQQMIVYQDQSRLLDSMLERISKWIDKEYYASLATLKEVLSDLRGGILEKLSRITQEYVEACNQAERNPRQDLLDARIDGDPEDIRFKLMFYHVNSSLAREYINKLANNEQEEERAQDSVISDRAEAQQHP